MKPYTKYGTVCKHTSDSLLYKKDCTVCKTVAEHRTVDVVYKVFVDSSVRRVSQIDACVQMRNIVFDV